MTFDSDGAPSAAPTERVVLLDEAGQATGTVDKLSAHLPPGHLHLAFSIFLFTSDGRLLLQRRASSKYHFAGLWSNSCCGHPRPGELVESAGRRRLNEELGVSCRLDEVGQFRYHARDDQSGLHEHENVHVLAGVSDARVFPDPLEIGDVRVVDRERLQRTLFSNPEVYTPWLPVAFTVVADWWRSRAWPGVHHATEATEPV
jgi:isopentenyl-diphosphate delta-isomerase